MANNKKVEKKESGIKDLYEGNELSVWDDGDFVTLAFGLTTIAFPKDNKIWKKLREDIVKFAKVLTKK